MKRTLTLKTERLVELTTEELHEVAGAEATLVLCVATTLLSHLTCGATRPVTLCSCLTGDYSIAC